MFFKVEDVPDSMRAVVVTDFHDAAGVGVQVASVPSPGPGEVLVRMAFSPVHPADLVSLRGRYAPGIETPFTPGVEGSGMVVRCGRGVAPHALQGRRVALMGLSPRGTWAQYVVAPVSRCIPLLPGISLKAAATLAVNPLTALGLLEPVIHDRQSVLVTVASGALGRQILSWGRVCGLHMIGCVHRPELRDDLKRAGFPDVLDASAPDFGQQLRIACRRHQVRFALDATSGPLLGMLVENLEEPGRIVVYGQLSRTPSTLSAGTLIFRDVGIAGFWLQRWWSQKTALERVRLAMTVQWKSAIFNTPVREVFPLDRLSDALAAARRNRSQGKVLLQLDPAAA